MAGKAALEVINVGFKVFGLIDGIFKKIGENDLSSKVSELKEKMNELLQLGYEIREAVTGLRDEINERQLGEITAQADNALNAITEIIDGRSVDIVGAKREMTRAVELLLNFIPQEVAAGAAAYVLTSYIAFINVVDDRAFAADVHKQHFREIEQLALDIQEYSRPTVLEIKTGWVQSELLREKHDDYYYVIRLSNDVYQMGYAPTEERALERAHEEIQRHTEDFWEDIGVTALLETVELSREFFQGENLRGNNAGNELVGGELNDYIRGEGGHDVLRGGQGDNSLHGGAGNDSLLAGSGDDLLRGGEGNDHLVASAGTNIIDGGDGVDHVDYRWVPESARSGVTVNLFAVDFQHNGVSRDLLQNIERVSGSHYDDHLMGDDGDNELLGHGGHDHLSGGGGRDVLRGGDGNDFLLDGGGVTSVEFEELYGDDGNDRLYGYGLSDGGDGNDLIWAAYNASGRAPVLTGGRGDDTFLFSSESLPRSDPETTEPIQIMGFDDPGPEPEPGIVNPWPPKGDLFDFSAFDANPNADGYQDMTFDDFVFTDQADGTTLIEVFQDDGDDQVDFRIQVHDGPWRTHNYTVDDFVF